MKQNDITRARRFANVLRFIDNLTLLNSDEDFEQSFKEIYPPELVLWKGSLSDDKDKFKIYLFRLEKINFLQAL